MISGRHPDPKPLRMGIFLTGWPAWQQLPRTMGCHGWRRAGSPEVSTGSVDSRCCGGICCSSTTSPLAGREGFLSITDGTAEQWYAPGFPLLIDPRMSLQPSLLLFPPLSPAARQGRFLLLPLLTTLIPLHSTMLPLSSPRTLATLPSSPVQGATFLHCSSTPQLLSYRQLRCRCLGGSFVVPGFGSVEQRWCCLFIFLPSVQKGRPGQGWNAIKLPKPLTLKTILGIQLRLLVHVSPLQMLMLVGLKNPLSG